jgi:hypothetical protein
VVGGAGWLLGVEIVSALKVKAETFCEEKVEGIAGCGRRFGVVACAEEVEVVVDIKIMGGREKDD